MRSILLLLVVAFVVVVAAASRCLALSLSLSLSRHVNPSTRLSMVGSSSSFFPEPERGSSSFSPEPESTSARYDYNDYNDGLSARVSTPPPATVTARESSPVDRSPERPKVVVFGASGRIGRRVLRKLMASGADVDVVAFVRDPQRLEQALYDEEDLVLGNLLDSDKKGGGPRLSVMVGDVVSPKDLRKHRNKRPSKSNTWMDMARASIRRMTRTAKNDHDNDTGNGNGHNATDVTADMRIDDNDDDRDDENDGALRDAVAGSSVLVSCLASRRPSNPWTDYLRVPIARVFRKDASRWCHDPTHPYYVHQRSTERILQEAEREQERRQAEARRATQIKEEMEEKEKEKEGRQRRTKRRSTDDEGFESEIAARLTALRKKRRKEGSRIRDKQRHIGDGAVRLPENGRPPTSADRIKFVRVSHAMLGDNPFRTHNVVANILWSQISRFELMAETRMEESETVDTIVLRPGEQTDDARNSNHTSLQLAVDGAVGRPSLVGREDVADLVVVSALTKTCRDDGTTTTGPTPKGGAAVAAVKGIDGAGKHRMSATDSAAHHYAWAVRWTGQHLSPPQGLRPDGLPDAAACFAKAIQDQRKDDANRRRKERRVKSYYGGQELIRWNRWSRGKMKPLCQSLAVAVPLYATMGFLSWYVFGQTFVEAMSRAKRFKLAPIILKFLPS